ncbi:MAG: VCBS repeat-containing protein [Nannocystaceae bacterium]|nr:VCBS repeat-containing protein [Nannocystaceae bacterium]
MVGRGLDTSLWNLGLPTLLMAAGCGPIIVLGETDTDGTGSEESAEGPGSDTSPSTTASTTASTTVGTATTVSTTSSGCVNDYECPPGYECVGGKCYYTGYCDGTCCTPECGWYYECFSSYDCGPGEICQYNVCAPLEPEQTCDPVPFGTSISFPIPNLASLAFIEAGGPPGKELLVAGDDGVALLANDGSSVPVDNQGFPFDLAVRDLDGDGDEDVALVDVEANAPRVLLQDGMWSAIELQPAETTHFLDTVDMEGDGYPDIVTHVIGGNVYLYPNDGPGQWLDPQYVWDSVSGLTRASLDGDAFEDLVVQSYSTIAIYGGTAFNATELYSGYPVGLRLIAAGNFNGSGEDDVVALEPINGYTIATTWPGPVLQPIGWGQTWWPSAVRVHSSIDLNGDGFLDVVGSDGTATLTVGWGGPQSDVDLFVCVSTFDAPVIVSHMTVGDFSGDGRNDIAITDGTTVEVLLRTD